jgi:hypothetical protein
MSVRRERYAALVRRFLASDPDPDRQLELVLAERRREFEEQAARIEQAIQDLERREQLMRDSRTSLERLLRLGTSDLESREAELVDLLRDVTAREERVRADEAELARRREELGAVELKRAAVERRERAVAEREAELDRRQAETAAAAVPEEPSLAFVPGSSYRLRELEPRPLGDGDTVVLDEGEYIVTRLGPSPLPGDPRRCAYLVLGPRGPRPSGGSS